MMVVTQILNPLIICCIIKCVTCFARESNITDDDNELQNLQRNYQTSLDNFRHVHPQPEEEFDAVTASQLSNIHEEYQRNLNELTIRKEWHNHRSKERAKFGRIFSIYAYLTFWIYLLYIILYSTTHLFGGRLFLVLFITSVVLAIVTYLIVLFEYSKSSERQYIKKLSSNVFAVQCIEAIRANQPSINFWAECYHSETRTRPTIGIDIYSNIYAGIETYQEKVVTNVVVEPVLHQYWRDTSSTELVNGFNDKSIINIKMTLSVEPGDDETKMAISEKYSAFRNKYRSVDVLVDFSIEKDVKGFKKRLGAYKDIHEKRIWVSSAFLAIATLLGLSWPYRWAFKSITSKTEFAVSKLIYICRPEQEYNEYVSSTV